MQSLHEQLQDKLLPGMYIPEPLTLLFTWIEENGLFRDTENGRIGFLYPEDKLRSGWTERERPGGTIIEFFAEGNEHMKYWFGHERPEVLNRICVFAQTGADGSMAALWLDEERKQKIVHLGSGSGSTLVCVLADEAIDFLRLLAIGYDEICWNETFSEPPNAESEEERIVHPNIEYQNWVKNTFSVSIPQRAIDIVKYPSEMDDSDSVDPFWRWVTQNVA